MKALKTLSTAIVAIAAMQASSIQAGLPDPGMTIQPGRTAVVITDPQNDFLSPEGVTWGVVGQSVTANNTVEHIESLLKAAKKNGMPVYVSPHYYYPTDDGWQFGGAVETMNKARIQMTWRCNCASAASTRSYWPECLPTSVSNRTCGHCWRQVSKSRW
jgi:hypothetical protein